MSSARIVLRASAHVLLIDQSGRMLFVQTAAGAWGLPATVLTFEVPPHRQVASYARQRLGIEVAERGLVLAHVSAHSGAGLGLVVSVGYWEGEPAPARNGDGPATRRWCGPGSPPAPLAVWDAAVLPSLMTSTLYSETGWRGRPTAEPADSAPVAGGQREPGPPVRRPRHSGNPGQHKERV